MLSIRAFYVDYQMLSQKYTSCRTEKLITILNSHTPPKEKRWPDFLIRLNIFQNDSDFTA